MHIFFSGIGGTGIGPLALIAKQAGFEVSGSDKQDSSYVHYLQEKGLNGIHIGQDHDAIAALHTQHPIDWFVYSSALPKENPLHPELVFCKENGIKTSKRDEFLSELLKQKQLKLLAVAGTHGKTTTTAMLIWLMQKLNIPISYSVGAKMSFADMGHYENGSEYFVYECDEYDRNFLAFEPFASLITGVSWDHQDIYPTKQDYNEAFQQFLHQSTYVLGWNQDAAALQIAQNERITILDDNDVMLSKDGPLKLLGTVNRRNALQVIWAVHLLTQTPLENLISLVNEFPGVSRRFEQLLPNLYTDYAHTAEKIKGAIDVAKETGKNIVVVYEGLHNRRQHFMLEQHQFDGLFYGASKVYWAPSYLAREDPNQKLLTPSDLIELTQLQNIAEAVGLNNELKQIIGRHLENGDVVLCISAGGGGSLDEWLRATFLPHQ